MKTPPFPNLITILAIAFGASTALADPPKRLPDYAWLPVAKNVLTVPISEYRKGAFDAAIKDVAGLFTIFAPQPKNDPTLRVKRTRYNPANRVLEISIEKRIGIGRLSKWIGDTRSVVVDVEAFNGCGAGAGYTIRMNTNEAERLREVHMRLCGNELPDGSLRIDAELALVVGRNYEQWVFWSAEDLYSSLPDSLATHVKRKSSFMPRAVSYRQMLSTLEVKKPVALFPEMNVVPQRDFDAEPLGDEEDGEFEFYGDEE